MISREAEVWSHTSMRSEMLYNEAESIKFLRIAMLQDEDWHAFREKE